jgi:hypothetical protein
MEFVSDISVLRQALFPECFYFSLSAAILPAVNTHWFFGPRTVGPVVLRVKVSLAPFQEY